MAVTDRVAVSLNDVLTTVSGQAEGNWLVVARCSAVLGSAHHDCGNSFPAHRSSTDLMKAPPLLTELNKTEKD